MTIQVKEKKRKEATLNVLFNYRYIFVTKVKRKSCLNNEATTVATYGIIGKGKGFSREQALKGPWSRLQIYVTFSTMHVVRSSLLHTGRLYPQEFLYILVLIFRG
jgi:hypothetical protein